MDLTDEALIESFRKTKDSSYFKSLVRRYQNRIYNAAYRMLGNGQEAEEVVQETYIKVHNNLGKFRQQSTFEAWIFRISHNICVDLLRVRQRRNSYQHLIFDPQAWLGETTFADKFVISQLADDTPCPAVQVDMLEQSEVIQNSLKELPDAQRAVIVLHDIEGFSYQEIAEIVDANLGTVRSRLYYGRMRLREILESYFSPVPSGSR